MHHDINPAEQIFSPDAQNVFEALHDTRLDRDTQKDLHIAIDLTFEFVRKLKELHPLAYNQIKVMLLNGKLI